MNQLRAFRIKVLAAALTACALLGASHVSAERVVASPTIVIAPPVAGDVRVGHRYHGQRKHRVAQYGVYYYLLHTAPNALSNEGFHAFDDDEDEFDIADTNRDGYLSQREARGANSQWGRDFRRIDTSGDGYLTREEIDEFYRR